jgi:glycosyltransferase involved in cell wall biosynthesis
MTSTRPHVAVIVQNALLELDLRPRREAEALAAAGYDVTLVGGTENLPLVRELLAPAVALEAFVQPVDGAGVRGQMREQGQALARTMRSLMRAGRRRPLAAVHAANPPDNLWVSPWVVRELRRGAPRFVFDQHDVAPVLLTEKFPNAAGRRGLEWAANQLERRSFAAASLVVFANEEYRVRAERTGLLRGDSVVVPNGWSLPDVGGDPALRRGAELLVAYVGMIGEQDNVDHLVDSVAAMPQRERVRVAVAGDGSALNGVKQRARDLGVDDRFEWLGSVSDRAALGALVGEADVCVAPELDTEFNRLATFVKIVEYMSLGKPVVAHRLPQTERLAGATIAYAEGMSADALGSAIHSLALDTARAGRLGRAARERFDEHISWQGLGAPRLVAAYDRLFSAHLPAASPEPDSRPRPSRRLHRV